MVRNKRFLQRCCCFIGVLLVCFSFCFFPAAASSFTGNSDVSYDRYYAVIPFDTVNISSGGASFSGPAFGSFLDIASGYDADLFPNHLPSWSPILVEQIGYSSSDADSPVPVILNYSGISDYDYDVGGFHLAYNTFRDIQIDRYDVEDLTITLSAVDFWIDSRTWALLVNNGLLKIPDACYARCEISVEYTLYNSTNKEYITGFESHSDGLRWELSSAGAYCDWYFPSFDVMFSDARSGNMIDGGVIVDKLVLTLDFSVAPSSISFGMLYDREVHQSDHFYVFTREFPVYIEVPAEDLNFTTWLVGTIGPFLDTPIFGQFSLGGLLSVIIGLSLLALFLKYFG